MKRFLSYLSSNFVLETHNFPNFIPVFIGFGIAIYFSLFYEPSTWLTSIIFGLSLFILLFINTGNSSERIKKYKKLFAFSTLKYVIKKLFKLAIYITVFPLLGHITLFIILGGYVISVFEYSKYLKYFAILYDNAFMKDIIKGLQHLFKPLTNKFKKTGLFTFLRDIIKTSHAKNDKSEKLIKLVFRETKRIYNDIIKSIIQFFHNAFFKHVKKLKVKLKMGILYIKNEIIKLSERFIPKNLISNVIRVAISFNFILFFIILGFFTVKMRTLYLSPNMLDKKIKNASVTARIIGVEYFENDYRITFDNIKIDKDPNTKLDKIRVKFKRNFKVPTIGETVSFTSTLLPPFEPDVVGSFNFSRYAFFKKLSASGRSFSTWQVAPTQIKSNVADHLYFSFMNMRDVINKKVERGSSSATSGIIMSMITGERNAIPKITSQNYNASGIAHLLAISGLHMTLITGFAFFVFRFLLTLIIPFSRRYNTKKLSIMFALIVAVFYLFLSGARIPTQRAFIMTLLGLIAILIDRNPFSMRFVCLTGIVLLILTPEALINPGFQMSFIAVIALIKLYELRDYWSIRYKCDGKTIRPIIPNIIWGNILVSLSTAFVMLPFIIYHFNNMQIYGVLGNFFAIPIFSFLVMPSILFYFILLPFGFENIPLFIIEKGVEVISFCADKIGNLPYALIQTKAMPITAFTLIVIGFIWFFMWQRKWRFFGIPLIIIGGIIYIKTPLISVYADKYAKTFVINDGSKFEYVNFSKYPLSTMLAKNLNTANAFETIISKTDKKIFEINNKTIAIVDRFNDYKYACQTADILFITFDKSKSYFKCHKPVFDKNFIKESTGVQVYIFNNRLKTKKVINYIKNRPWGLNVKEIDFDYLKDLKIFE